MTNHLAHTSSPYLLQHAENPVDWYPWGDEALKKSRDENKPIFLSIGYAACHWCHVMAHESFEDPAIAGLMNAHFVNIKVDREERPDLDNIYMSYVVAVTGQGGWPMNVFLTPEGKPFYGGTYFPPTPRHNLPSFREVLEAIARLWKEDSQQLISSSEEISRQLSATQSPAPSGKVLDMAVLTQAVETIGHSYDWQNGGWGDAPKFPQPMLIEFLLQQGSRGNQAALDMARHALGAMAQGGMYDLLGGGFARYSVDPTWLIPHFEKMLYDNAQLGLAYLHAYLVTKEPQLREICEATLDFVLREMTHPLGGFYSSLDADSEGEEGKYYLWTDEEIRQALPAEAESELFMAAYGLGAGSPRSNTIGEAMDFEGRNILRRAKGDEELAGQFHLEAAGIPGKLASLRSQLLKARNTRVRPNTDDKVLAGWNAQMLGTFTEAGRALNRPEYVQAASHNAEFILEHMFIDGKLMRSWRAGAANHPAFLEDHAGLALALLAHYQTDPNPRWYQVALKLNEHILAHFKDPLGGFFDTSDEHEALLYRPKDIQDNATPSGNALAAMLLLRLSAYEGRGEWNDQAMEMISSNLGMAQRYPSAFAQWLSAMDFALGPVNEVAIIGDLDQPGTRELLEPLRKGYFPRMVMAASSYPPPQGSPALLNERTLLNGAPTAYVCRGFVCRRPVNTVEEMLVQLEEEEINHR